MKRNVRKLENRLQLFSSGLLFVCGVCMGLKTNWEAWGDTHMHYFIHIQWYAHVLQSIRQCLFMFCCDIKDVVLCSGPFWKLISRFFFITKYNTIVSIFLCFYWHSNWHSWFLQERHLNFYRHDAVIFTRKTPWFLQERHHNFHRNDTVIFTGRHELFAYVSWICHRIISVIKLERRAWI